MVYQFWIKIYIFQFDTLFFSPISFSKNIVEIFTKYVYVFLKNVLKIFVFLK